MNNTILSICIPTYNRAQYLKKTLTSIVSQFKNEDIRRQVEIVISDNASEDNTREVVEEFKNRFENVKYFRNNKNLGFDRNLYNAIRKSEGLFCWTLNDDKILNSNALDYMLNILKSNQTIGFFCVNQDIPFSESREKIFQNGNYWLKEMGLTGGRLSQCILKKDCIPTDVQKYFGNYWFHFSIALEIIKDKPVLFIRNVLEKDDDNRICRWAENGATLTVFIELKNIVNNLINFGYEPEVIKDICTSMAKNLPRQMITAKIYGLKINFKGLRILIKNFYKYPIYLFISIFIFFTPSFVFKFLKKMKKFLNNK